MGVISVILNLSPELEARVNDWASKTGKPREELAVELLDEYFDETDTGRAISEAVRAKMFNQPRKKSPASIGGEMNCAYLVVL